MAIGRRARLGTFKADSVSIEDFVTVKVRVVPASDAHRSLAQYRHPISCSCIKPVGLFGISMNLSPTSFWTWRYQIATVPTLVPHMAIAGGEFCSKMENE
jgi:hypothetical protein